MTHSPFENACIISDLSVGYGTPQILSFAEAIAARYACHVDLLEPDQPERPPLPGLTKSISIVRLFTVTHPYSDAGAVDYNLQVLAHLERTKPDLVILCSFMGAPAIHKLKHKPKFLILYALEHTNGAEPATCRLFQRIAHKIDFAIFPEENRAALDAPRLGLAATPKAVLYNGSSVAIDPLPHYLRNGRFFYGGLVHPRLTYGDDLLGGAFRTAPIDIYGIIDGYADRGAALARYRKNVGRTTYQGYVETGRPYLERLSHYAYSIVMWVPVNEATRFAAPNKFFDAIQAGVPVISTPHPLCARLVRRYNCGLLTQGWETRHIVRAFAAAESILGQARYGELMEGARRAAAELNFAAQFARVADDVDRTLAQRAKRTVPTARIRTAR